MYSHIYSYTYFINNNIFHIITVTSYALHVLCHSPMYYLRSIRK